MIIELATRAMSAITSTSSSIRLFLLLSFFIFRDFIMFSSANLRRFKKKKKKKTLINTFNAS